MFRIRRFLSLVVFESLLLGFLVACPGGGENATPAGEPTSSLPREWQVLGSGSIVSRSERFQSRGGLSFVYGGTANGERYQLLNPEVSIQQTVEEK